MTFKSNWLRCGLRIGGCNGKYAIRRCRSPEVENAARPKIPLLTKEGLGEVR
jgi:hypothetical protein